MSLSWLRLVRASALFSPAADVLAGLCLVDAPVSALALRTIFASVLVYAAGMALNDFADRAEDARQRKERPIPRGEIAPAHALALGLVLLLLGIAVSGTPVQHGILAALVLFYDFVAKRSNLAAIATMGSLRGLNLLVGAWIPAQGLSTPVILAATAYGLYIAVITALGICEDRASSPARVVNGLLVAAIGFATAGVALAAPRATWTAFVVPVLAAFLVRFVPPGRPVTPERIRAEMMKLLLGCMVYASTLCLAAERWWEAVVIAAAILVSRLVARTIALT